jgi:hypothetical protein
VRVGQRQLDPQPDRPQRRAEPGAVPVQKLGQLLVDRAATGVLAGLDRIDGRSSHAARHVDDEVVVEVLVLSGHDRCGEPGGRGDQPCGLVMRGEDRLRAPRGVADPRKREQPPGTADDCDRGHGEPAEGRETRPPAHARCKMRWAATAAPAFVSGTR